MTKLSLYPPSHFEHRPPSKREGELEKGAAERIITTLPSATEIVALLGLGEKLVGITHECDYPPEVRSKPIVMRSVFDSSHMTNRAIDDAVLERVTKGESVYKIDEKLLRSLAPDLIITQGAMRGLCNSSSRGGENYCEFKSQTEDPLAHSAQPRGSLRGCPSGGKGDGQTR